MRKFVFGPVPSRRLGFSLGVDIIPRKYCNFDCIYCQVGKTTEKNVARRAFLEEKEVVNEVIAAVHAADKVDFVTFSGSGEPTLNKNLGTMIREIKKSIDTPIAVITNSTLLSFEEVRDDLMDADVVLPSLDAASEQMFQRINRPQPGINLIEIIDGIKVFRKCYRGLIWLEIMLIKGMNDSSEDLRKMRDILYDLNVDKIHLNTVTRPPCESITDRMELEELEQIRSFFGDKCEVISPFEKDGSIHKHYEDWVETLLDILKRRALTLRDIVAITGVKSSVIKKTLRSMQKKGLIKDYYSGTEVYYITAGS